MRALVDHFDGVVVAGLATLGGQTFIERNIIPTPEYKCRCSDAFVLHGQQVSRGVTALSGPVVVDGRTQGTRFAVVILIRFCILFIAKLAKH